MRKPHARSRLKTLPEDVQARIADWCAQDTLESAVQRCASELSPPVQTNKSSMGEFFAWWQLKETFAKADSKAKAVGDLLRNQFPDATPEKIAASEQLVFTMQAANAGDESKFIALESLRLLKETAAHNARMDAAKLEQKERALAQKDRDLRVLEERFKRDTCELFLKWSQDERARAIASSTGTNAEKIEQLGLAMFGEDWKS